MASYRNGKIVWIVIVGLMGVRLMMGLVIVQRGDGMTFEGCRNIRLGWCRSRWLRGVCKGVEE
jgi:hypothetical protein